MAIKVIAQRRELKIGKKPGKKFVMRPDLYVPIQEKKVFAEASTHSGISAGVIKAAWDAAGEVPLRLRRRAPRRRLPPRRTRHREIAEERRREAAPPPGRISRIPDETRTVC